MINACPTFVRLPMKLTKLDTHPARPGKVRLFIDEVYAFELSRKSVLALKVAEGEVLTSERHRLLESTAAREAAIGLLARRERSRAELRSALRRKKFDVAVIDTVLGQIEADGLQSDSRFASAWVETRRRLSPRGKAALAYELRQKGIPDARAAEALRRYSGQDEQAALRELIASRLARWDGAKEDRPKLKQRLLGFLSRRGFAYEDIRAVLARDFPDWL